MQQDQYERVQEMTKQIHIARGRYTERGISHYFDIEFFSSRERAEAYIKARKQHQAALGETDVEYYVYTSNIY